MNHQNDSLLPILSRSHSGGDSVAVSIKSPSPSSWDLGPCQYLFWDNSALNKLKKQTKACSDRLWYISLARKWAFKTWVLSGMVRCGSLPLLKHLGLIARQVFWVPRIVSGFSNLSAFTRDLHLGLKQMIQLNRYPSPESPSWYALQHASAVPLVVCWSLNCKCCFTGI